MANELDTGWDIVTEIRDHLRMPCLRFAVGARHPLLTWLVPSPDSIWTMYIAAYNPFRSQFDPPETLMFQYLRARDVGIYTPGITPSMQLAMTPDKIVLIGTRNMDFNKGAFFSADVIRRESGRPVKIDELKDADYIFRSHGGSWEGLQDVSERLFAQIPDPLALGMNGVYDISVFSKESEIYIIGSTWDAKLWFSFSPDGGMSWSLPLIIPQRGVHPVLTETTNGRLMAFYVKADTQVKVRKEGDRITISPATGSLWFIERVPDGEWSYTKQLWDRSDVLHCSACSDGNGHLYVAFDVYPEEPAHVVWGEDALISGKPLSQVYITSSSDSGKTWTKPVSISRADASFFNPEIMFCQDNLIVGAINRIPEGWSIVSMLLSIKELQRLQSTVKILKQGLGEWNNDDICIQ